MQDVHRSRGLRRQHHEHLTRYTVMHLGSLSTKHRPENSRAVPSVARDVVGFLLVSVKRETLEHEKMMPKSQTACLGQRSRKLGLHGSRTDRCKTDGDNVLDQARVTQAGGRDV